MQEIKTDVTILIRLFDTFTGAPKTGLDVTDLQIMSMRLDESNAVTESAWTSLVDDSSAGASEHNDYFAEEVSNGYYRIDVPDAYFAVGAAEVIILVKDNTNDSIIVQAKEYNMAIEDSRDMMKSDWYVDNTTDPAQWKLKFQNRHTSANLVVKDLKDLAGAAVVSAATQWAKQEDE